MGDEVVYFIIGGFISMGIVYRELRTLGDGCVSKFDILWTSIIAFLFSWLGVVIFSLALLIYVLVENGKMEIIIESAEKDLRKLGEFSLKFFDTVFFIRRKNEN